MTTRRRSDKKATSEQASSKKVAQTVANTANPWRDRLHTTKSGTKCGVAAGTTGGADLRQRFQKTAAGSTDRKSRKGLRPG